MGVNSDLNILSWNVQGMNHPIKRRKVLDYLRSKKCDIALLQETHLSENESRKLNRDWVGEVIYAAAQSKRAGVAILFHKSLNLRVKRHEADLEGRWVEVVANIDGFEVMLLNIYGPNQPIKAFWKPLIERVHNSMSLHCIFGGDLNLPLNPILDRSSKARYSAPRAQMPLTHAVRDKILVDPWRVGHPLEREYSFYSAVHQTYSRIDYLLTTPSILSRMTHTKIYPIVISDHAPILLVIDIEKRSTPDPQWRFSSSLLEREGFREHVMKATESFFAVNVGSVDSVTTLWDAYKATIRGEIISFASKCKTQDMKEERDLEQKVSRLEAIHVNSPGSDGALKELLKYRYELNTKISRRIHTAHLRDSAVLYGESNRAGRVLANYLRKRSQRTRVLAIKDGEGALGTTDKDILDIFSRYYAKLYESEVLPGDIELDSFFAEIPLPHINKVECLHMERPLSAQEIRDALTSLPGGKAPGPDGLTPEFFRAFQDCLIPWLIKLYEEIIADPDSLATFHLATTVLIPKPGKDHLSPQNYRPISLLNLENKIFAKALATRLAPLIPLIIDSGQTGFVKGRLVTDHARLLCNILESAPDVDKPSAVISIDAEKAFDRVEWRFLEYTLSRFGVGPFLRQMVKVLYTCPRTRLLINGKLSSTVTLHRGTRQGCPLSPLLFVMVLEPFLAKLRLNEKIKGIVMGSKEVKLTAYADDVLLYISDPEASFPELLRAIDEYGALSGYKVNWAKTEVMPITPLCTHAMFKGPKVTWVARGLKYLGVKFAPSLRETLEDAEKTIMESIRETRSEWSPLHLSWWGRIEALKMVLMPRILYVFSMIPTLFEPRFYKRVEKELSGFVWGGKPPRIAWWKLTLPKQQGGLNLPRVLSYHKAFLLRGLSHWFDRTKDHNTPGWVDLERRAAGDIPLWVVAEMPGHLPALRNRIVADTKVHFQQILTDSQSKALYKFDPTIWYNPDIRIAGRTLYWPIWANKGIHYASQLFDSKGMLPFENLQEIYDLPERQRWRYTQLKGAMSKKRLHYITQQLDPSPLVSSFFARKEHLASRLYKGPLAPPMKRLTGIEAAWGKDLDSIIEEADWDKIWAYTSKVLPATSINQSLLFVRHRATWTPMRKWRAGFEPDGLCWRGCSLKGTLIHVLWECPRLSEFWREVIREINMILNTDFALSPLFALFAHDPVMDALEPTERGLARMLQACALQIVLRSLKSDTILSAEWWWQTVTYWRKMEGALSSSFPNRQRVRDMWHWMDECLLISD